MWLLWWRSQSDGDWTDQWTFGQCNLNFWEQNWRYWSNWKRLINGIIFLGEFPRFFKIFLYKYNDTCRNTGRGEQIRWRCSQRWLSDCVCLWNIPGYPFIYFFFSGSEKTIHHKLKVFLNRKPWEWGFNGWLRGIFDRKSSHWCLIFLFLAFSLFGFYFFFLKRK